MGPGSLSLGFGLAQMVGAAIGACLLVQTGISGPTLGAFGVTDATDDSE